MPACPRNGSWHFQSLWEFPGSLPITHANTSGWLVAVDSAIRRDIIERTTCLSLLRSAQLKYKLSYLHLALTKSPMTLPVSGYIQSEAHRAVDRDQLLRWFPSNWSPVLGKLGQNEAYRNWLLPDPDYRHVQVYGETAVTFPKSGPVKIKVRLPGPETIN